MQGCMPIKILDFMAASLPVLAPNIPVVESILSEGRNLGCEACFWHVSVWTAAYHQVKQSLLLMF